MDRTLFEARGGEDIILVIGAGRFGARAARILGAQAGSRIIAVDIDQAHLERVKSDSVETVQCDGVVFLTNHFSLLSPDCLVVPALPVHLAAEWLKRNLEGCFHVVPRPISVEVEKRLPNTWRIDEGLLLTSYADFICPEDCEEPEYCTLSGEKRDPPMRTFLKDLKVEGFCVHVVPSQQLAAGVGGYRLAALESLRQTVTAGGAGKNWIIATACSCHGVLSAFGIEPRPICLHA